jgi:hypothetical protein
MFFTRVECSLPSSPPVSSVFTPARHYPHQGWMGGYLSGVAVLLKFDFDGHGRRYGQTRGKGGVKGEGNGKE